MKGIFSLYILTVLTSSVQGGPGNCLLGAPDVPPKHRGTYPPDDQGLYYQYALYSTDKSNEYYGHIKCYSFTWIKNLTLSVNGLDAYTLGDKYYNKTSNKYVIKTDYYAIDKEDDSLYIAVDPYGALIIPSDTGRVVLKEPTYYVDYSWFEKDTGEPGECGYWWQLYGSEKMLPDAVYNEAIKKITALKLATHHFFKMDNTHCP